ncbi:MGDG synthase family glycosyltransferase [Bacillus sp. J33]|uniref:MGDG synthase family glycosyltransferase n=1 Tax=Bacillus sp. J33 TaxID=935836 RepID=UPI00047D9BAE|nr:glycosyltransferase [Bacillus sp. J33]
MSKKVLILSEAIGNGHTRAAEALVQGISHLDPSIHTKILEVGRSLHPITSKLLVNSYLKMVILCPSLWRKMYQYKQNMPISNLRKLVIYQLFHRKIECIIEQEKPHLIICTHPFTSSSVSRLKNRGHSFELCTLVTDYHVHGAWVHKEVDFYLVSCKDVSNQLMEMGIPNNRLIVTGMPIDSNFWVKKNKEDARKKLALNNIPTVMVMGGGLGLGGIKQIASELLKWKEKLQVIICTGKNEKLRRSLLKDEIDQHPNVHILGYVEHVDEWMASADILITKPGGLTCYEAISKGLPICIYQPIPGHEENNCDYLVKKGLAIEFSDLKKINNLIEKLLYSPKEIEISKDKIKEFQKNIDPLASAGSIIQILCKPSS